MTTKLAWKDFNLVCFTLVIKKKIDAALTGARHQLEYESLKEGWCNFLLLPLPNVIW